MSCAHTSPDQFILSKGRLARAAAVLLACWSCASLSGESPPGPTVERATTRIHVDGHPVLLEEYTSPSPGRHPAVLLLHGSGGLHFYSGDATHRYARGLVSQGFVAVVVHYFDATGTFSAGDEEERRCYDEWVKTVRRAISAVRARPDVDTARVGLLGHSLGAYLAIGVAAEDRRVAAVVDISGGLEPWIAKRVTHLPPALILHGMDDDVVPPSASALLARFLADHHVPYEMRLYPREGHKFEARAESDALARAAEFLQRNGHEGGVSVDQSVGGSGTASVSSDLRSH
jgi:dienelactone hydrolase